MQSRCCHCHLTSRPCPALLWRCRPGRCRCCHAPSSSRYSWHYGCTCRARLRCTPMFAPNRTDLLHTHVLFPLTASCIPPRPGWAKGSDPSPLPTFSASPDSGSYSPNPAWRGHFYSIHHVSSSTTKSLAARPHPALIHAMTSFNLGVFPRRLADKAKSAITDGSLQPTTLSQICYATSPASFPSPPCAPQPSHCRYPDTTVVAVSVTVRCHAPWLHTASPPPPLFPPTITVAGFAVSTRCPHAS
jgi:hypothetical protein